jgi:hypothetical protein
MDTMHTTWWMFWSREQSPGVVPYIEDVFFADLEWLDAWRFFEFPESLPFQDVYDLIGLAIRTMTNEHLAPKIFRMQQGVNRILHLWHPKTWGSWTPEIRDWFMAYPERWRGTPFLDRAMWDQLIRCRGAMPQDCNPVNAFRWAPGGTVTRFGEYFKGWLKSGGKDQLLRFFQQSGMR